MPELEENCIISYLQALSWDHLYLIRSAFIWENQVFGDVSVPTFNKIISIKIFCICIVSKDAYAESLKVLNSKNLS